MVTGREQRRGFAYRNGAGRAEDRSVRWDIGIEVERAVDAVLDDPRAAFRLKLLRATRRLLADKGLGVSMDDIADAAGVNRRTLFRHVNSRDALVADALSSAMDWYDTQLERAVPADRPLDRWIADLALQFMRIHTAAGRGLWQLAATPDEELPSELAAVNVRRRSDRRAAIPVTAHAIWQRAGGNGPCPPVISDAVAIAMSSFTSRSMVDDLGREPEPLATSIGTMLATLVDAQVAAHTPQPEPALPAPTRATQPNRAPVKRSTTRQ